VPDWIQNEFASDLLNIRGVMFTNDKYLGCYYKQVPGTVKNKVSLSHHEIFMCTN
jgi:hypothetical protein